jgi:hypothetical protein
MRKSRESRDEPSRVLSPMERVSEVLFGLIMVLTFTGSLSAAESSEADIRAMLVGAIGCNLAWALIDGIMYLMSRLSEHAANYRAFNAVRRARSEDEIRATIAEVAPPLLAVSLSASELERLRGEFLRMTESPSPGHLEGRDWFGAVAVFFLVFASTFPVVLPFFFEIDAMTALRISNAIAVAMMFVLGYAFGRLADYRPLLTGGAMVLLGAALVTLTIALGG